MKGVKYPEAIDHPVFSEISRVADKLQLETYVIGGFVRDFILKRNNVKDIDIVCVGNGILLAQEVAKALGLTKQYIHIFKRYGTAMLSYQSIDIEFVGARKESYSEDSRNPSVSPGSLKDDQNRRDFTINTLALRLNSEHFANLLDPFDGLKDFWSVEYHGILVFTQISHPYLPASDADEHMIRIL